MSEKKEIRLDLRVNGTTKTFIQDFVPYSKALDYTAGEAAVLKGKEDENGNLSALDQIELDKYRVEFVAGLFDDPDVTAECILDGLDTNNKDEIMDIIMYRVLGFEEIPSSDPKKIQGAN